MVAFVSILVVSSLVLALVAVVFIAADDDSRILAEYAARYDRARIAHASRGPRAYTATMLRHPRTGLFGRTAADVMRPAAFGSRRVTGPDAILIALAGV